MKKFLKYETAEAASNAAKKAKTSGSKLVIKLPDNKFTYVPIATGSDMMANIVAQACGAEVVDYVICWSVW